MPKLTYEQLDNAGSSTAGFIASAAKQVRNRVCDAYRNYKGWYHSNINLDSPAGALLEGFWDAICPLEPPYVPPPPANSSFYFEGGQCENRYYVNFDIRMTKMAYEGQYEGQRVYPHGLEVRFWGPVLGAGLIWDPDMGQMRVFLRNANGQSMFGGLGGQVGWFYIENITFAKSDWSADNCGSLPPPAPSTPPAPPAKISTNITITNNNNVDVTFPIEISPKIELPDVNIPVFIPIFAPNFNLNPQFSINPKFDVSLQPKLELKFGSEGVEYEFKFDGDVNNNTVSFGDLVNIATDIKNHFNTTINNNNNELDCDICDELEQIKNYAQLCSEGMKLTTINVPLGKCTDYVYSEQTLELPVIAGLEAQTLAQFQAARDLIRHNCRVPDYSVGEPLKSYERSAFPCLVLYFNDTRTTKLGIGRYLQIPLPNLEAASEWYSTSRLYEPGPYYQYTQFQHSRGPKLQIYGKSPEFCTQWMATLRTLTTLTDDDVYHDAPPRRVTAKDTMGLYLVRASYFTDNRDRKSGRQTGQVIWEGYN